MTAFFHFTRLRSSALCLLVLCTVSLFGDNRPGRVAGNFSTRERLSLERRWLFHEGDIPFPVITGHLASYNNAKTDSS